MFVENLMVKPFGKKPPETPNITQTEKEFCNLP